MTINISLTGSDLAGAGKDALAGLVDACSALASSSLGTEIELPDAPHTAKTSDGIILPGKVYTDEPVPPRMNPAEPVKAITSAPRKAHAPAPPPVAPAVPQPAAAAPQSEISPVPTAPAPAYTIEELQTACAPLMDANRMADLQQVLTKFGAASLLDVPKEQYGALATDLRALGARL